MPVDNFLDKFIIIPFLEFVKYKIPFSELFIKYKQSFTLKFVKNNKSRPEGRQEETIMSETQNITNNNFKLPDAVDNAIGNAVNNVFDKPTKSIGDTISDIWFIATSSITEAAEKRRIVIQHNLEEFKKEIDARVQAIPVEKQIEPDTRIVATAIQDALFAVSNKEIRELFAGLIAGASNSDYADMVHPSFSLIIKQMSPLDAELLKTFFFQNMQPICEYRLISTDLNGHKHYKTLKSNVFLVGECDGFEDTITKRSVAISSLVRLGMIEIQYGQTIADKNNDIDLYKNFHETHLYLKYAKTQYEDGDRLSVEKGFAKLTPLGNTLLHTCCTITDFVTIKTSNINTSPATPHTNQPAKVPKK